MYSQSLSMLCTQSKQALKISIVHKEVISCSQEKLYKCDLKLYMHLGNM